MAFARISEFAKDHPETRTANHEPVQGKNLDETEMTANRSGAWNDLKADPAVRFAASLGFELL